MSSFDEPDLYIDRRVIGDCIDEVSLSRTTINITSKINAARSPSAGAVSTFFGTTRDTFEGKDVTHLEYEAYPEMALPSMLDICARAREKWSLKHIIMQHKIGDCPISDVSIAIIVSSKHRKDSLEAVNFMINELKDTVPIWKKECYGEGSAATWKDNKLDSGAKPVDASTGDI
eukprot:CAMPEP_0170361516 /NCGR_PEP_ID=MMETSP0117_2-20130122/3847_1 /TAXON_ID=400756 /ORGANISM="Durinskia baltica, Strain CSIRO CS-38" /LENGTH=173 /DNA_ID=CAMNT_0010615885 /DNA_START=81 /DNA_END=602 /DNA_ORIENTATION=+